MANANQTTLNPTDAGLLEYGPCIRIRCIESYTICQWAIEAMPQYAAYIAYIAYYAISDIFKNIAQSAMYYAHYCASAAHGAAASFTAVLNLVQLCGCAAMCTAVVYNSYTMHGATRHTCTGNIKIFYL